jgi:RimJ/RimL family protein N-acetyltransferase
LTSFTPPPDDAGVALSAKHPDAPAVSLRETTDEDLPILFRHQADPVASQMAAFPSRDEEAFFAHWARLRANETNTTRTVVADGVVVGGIGSFFVEGERDIGYWIDRAEWGKGIASAALAAYLDVDRTRPISARVAAHNAGSRRVLEKCGFRLVDRVPASDTGDVEELVFRLDEDGTERG